MVDVIDSGEPAVMVCHWPGVYFNGEKIGFNILKEVKKRLDQKYNNLIWMKLSEISRYWAAKELTSIKPEAKRILLKAPFAAPGFTIKTNITAGKPQIKTRGEIKPLVRIKDLKELKSNNWFIDKSGTVFCFDLQKGESELIL
jgi:hypothetical protein